MKRFVKPFFLLFFLIMLVVGVMLAQTNETNSLLGNPVISPEEMGKLCKEKQMAEAPFDLFSYQNQPIPYISDTNTFLLPIEEAADKQGVLSANDYGMIYIIEQENLNQDLRICVVNDEEYFETYVIMICAPVLMFQTEEFENENAYGKMFLYTPNDSEINDYSCKISDAKLSYDVSEGVVVSKERHYSLKLLKENNAGEIEQNKISLAGLRKDDDWELDSLYQYPNQILEFYEFWNQYCVAEGNEHFSIYYQNVDFYLDGEYKGPYLLKVPVDDKQLEHLEGKWIVDKDMGDAVNVEAINQMIEDAMKDLGLALHCNYREEKQSVYAIPKRVIKK